MNKLVDTIFRFKWIVFLSVIAFALAAGSGTQHLYFNDDYRIFFDKDNPQLVEHEAVQNTYNRIDNVFIAIKPQKGVFEQEFLASLEQLTSDSWQIPYSTRVDSLANYQHTQGNLYQ